MQLVAPVRVLDKAISPRSRRLSAAEHLARGRLEGGGVRRFIGEEGQDGNGYASGTNPINAVAARLGPGLRPSFTLARHSVQDDGVARLPHEGQLPHSHGEHVIDSLVGLDAEEDPRGIAGDHALRCLERIEQSLPGDHIVRRQGLQCTQAGNRRNHPRQIGPRCTKNREEPQEAVDLTGIPDNSLGERRRLARCNGTGNSVDLYQAPDELHGEGPEPCGFGCPIDKRFYLRPLLGDVDDRRRHPVRDETVTQSMRSTRSARPHKPAKNEKSRSLQHAS
ncbi:unannotated protein [freshwater metagenome]|uniref:Unannotated protein n=1 Tax=freshwater metagenome TaxID=449393 RepID=A0A6J7N7A1_9ZZZZ